MRYPVFIEKTATSYGAHVPDLPGCIAVGKTLEDVRKLISEAMEMHIEGMREDGDEVPEPPFAVEWVEASEDEAKS